MGCRKNVFLVEEKMPAAFYEMGEKARDMGSICCIGVDFYVVTEFVRIDS